MDQQPPDVLAMVFADTVVVDVATGKRTIQGIFHSLTAQAFPWTYPSLTVHVVLTEGCGTTPLSLRLIDLDEVRPPLFELETEVTFPDPLAELEVVFAQTNIVFPRPGEYRVQSFGAGEPLRERRLQIVSN